MFIAIHYPICERSNANHSSLWLKIRNSKQSIHLLLLLLCTVYSKTGHGWKMEQNIRWNRKQMIKKSINIIHFFVQYQTSSHDILVVRNCLHSTSLHRIIELSGFQVTEISTFKPNAQSTYMNVLTIFVHMCSVFGVHTFSHIE